jgi:hypothetical protein
LDDGKLKAYQVPRNIANAFKLHDVGGLAAYGRIMTNAVYKVFHPLYVTFSPGFLVANPWRDLRRTHVNLGAVGLEQSKMLRKELESQGMSSAEAKVVAKSQKISLGQVLWAFFKSIPAARRRAKGISDVYVDQMLEEKALAVPYTDVAAETGEAVPADFAQPNKGVVESAMTHRRKAVRMLGHLLNGIRVVGEIQETATKMAANRLLEERGVATQERAHKVRKYAGTPDYKQKGLATPITNSVLMYSKVRLNGWQAETSLATSPGTAGAWWWRRMVWTIMPTTWTKLAMYGYFGPVVAKLIANIPQYFLDNYDVIPLGTVDDDGEEKTVFLTIPKDDVGRFLGNIWSRMLDLAIEAGGGETRKGSVGALATDLLGEAWGEVVPAANPILDMASKWGQFAVGLNPYDSFFGEPIIPRNEWEAGGWEATKKMLSWNVDKFGVISTVAHTATGPTVGQAFDPDAESTIETTIRSIPGASRILRVSNRGQSEVEWAELENEEREAAKFRLGLPKSARRLTTQRYLLQRRPSAETDPEDAGKRELLNEWYSRTYLPQTKAIREAVETGQEGKADELRAELDQASKAVDLTDPKALKHGLRRYQQKQILAFTAPYTGKKDRAASVSAAGEVLGSLGITYGQARMTLEEAWLRRWPTSDTRESEKFKERVKQLQLRWGKVVQSSPQP